MTRYVYGGPRVRTVADYAKRQKLQPESSERPIDSVTLFLLQSANRSVQLNLRFNETH